MNTGQSQLDVDAGRCRFMFGNAALDEVCRGHLMADAREAQLSPLFRAYYQIRSLIPLTIRQLLQRYRRVQTTARWCYPDEFVAELTKHATTSGNRLSILHPWPDGSEFAFVLTHDIESADGQRRVAAIADMEEELGFRSSWNFVPFKYPVDYGLMRDLVRRGFEIGVHGYNHDGRLFSSRNVFDRRVTAINHTLKAWSAVGFRSPMMHRNVAWMQDLDILYDSSCFDADPYQAMPGGVGSVWPFIAGRFVELPYTLPQDHTLFVALGERSGRIWQSKFDYLVRLCGMSLVNTHPDYLDSTWRVDCYRELLSRARDSAEMWHALPRDVAAWWRERDASTLQVAADGSRYVVGPAALRGRPAAIRLDDSLQDIPWSIEPCKFAARSACGTSHD